MEKPHRVVQIVGNTGIMQCVMDCESYLNFHLSQVNKLNSQQTDESSAPTVNIITLRLFLCVDRRVVGYLEEDRNVMKLFTADLPTR